MRSTTSKMTARRGLAAVATAVLVATPLAACSSDNGGASANGGSSSSSAPPKAVAAIPALTGETTEIALDTGFTDALTQLKLTPGVVGDAQLQETTLVFPITGGNVSVFKQGEVSPYVIGQVQHEGSGLSLTAGGTTVELTNFNVDPGASVVYGDVSLNGKPVVASAPLFNLDGRTLKPLQTEGNTAILEGTKVLISGPAADLLNQTFKTDAVKQGLLVGIAKITVNVS